MTVDTQELRELLAGLPLVKWSKTGSTVNIPETEDFAGKALHITGLDKQYARRLAGYIAAANPSTVSALLDENDALRAELQAHRSFLSALKAELGLVLTDDDTELSPGALRTLLWADREMTNALALPPAPPQGDGA